MKVISMLLECYVDNPLADSNFYWSHDLLVPFSLVLNDLKTILSQELKMIFICLHHLLDTQLSLNLKKEASYYP